MLQLTYISTATRQLQDTDINLILEASRRNNALVGVTGLLIYDGKRFLQALEGEETAVHLTYDRINHDPRHRGIVLLGSRQVETRSFGAWSMAAQKVASAFGTTVPEVVDRLTAQVEDANTRELFRGFARVRAAA
ncbi:BLUF domain-containing protein [Sphingomonas naphthae]|uniref:BLUF domain-containing protein n=1 Tax=Sphingomonas naphthae TaxID=1813468 RepID=A0ABY7TK47_9SPHN|nr:BLUF domain-containing protein [Sphingomonas naphthae]WCT72659.1 BLUF domain-containing protein [Sphingomonas naphthae]